MTPEHTALVAGLDEYCKCSVMDTDTTKCAPCKAAAAIRALAGDVERLLEHKVTALAKLADCRAEVERLNKWADGFSDAQLKERQTAEAYQRELRAEVAALRKDAERYRWLRTRMNWSDMDVGMSTARTAPIIYFKARNWTHCDVRNEKDRPASEHIDEYLDAALADKQGET